MPFIDLHCDAPSRLLANRRRGGSDTLRSGHGGEVTLEKLRRSGYLLQAFALFVDLSKTEDPWGEVLALGALYGEALENNADWLTPVRAFSDLEGAGGRIGALLTVEEGGVLGGDLSRLETLHAMGVRMMTLTWNHENALASPNGRPGGLTDLGREALGEMERLGILPDVSHLGDDGFWEVCRLAKGPILASHSCCRALRDHQRNLTDEMIRAIADRGGLVGVNFYAPFLGSHPVGRGEDIARHLRHLIRVGGLRVAALGSDFDGMDCPTDFGDAGDMPRLVRVLEKAGFTPGEIEAVTWRNAWAFLRETL